MTANREVAKLLVEFYDGMAIETATEVADVAVHAYEQAMETAIRVTNTVSVELRALALISALQLIHGATDRDLEMMREAITKPE